MYHPSPFHITGMAYLQSASAVLYYWIYLEYYLFES